MCPTISNQALVRLIEGNRRFLSGRRTYNPKYGIKKLKDLAAKGQSPFAVILTCSDSRVPVELLFDCDPGDLFVIRVAGAVLSRVIIASIEYAVYQLGVSLCVVMGHTDCGAVKAALDSSQNKSLRLSSNLMRLMGEIDPVIKSLQSKLHPDLSPVTVRQITLESVRRAGCLILERSEIIQLKVKSKSLQIVEALFDLQTGKVRFHGHSGQSPLQGRKRGNLPPSIQNTPMREGGQK